MKVCSAPHASLTLRVASASKVSRSAMTPPIMFSGMISISVRKPSTVTRAIRLSLERKARSCWPAPGDRGGGVGRGGGRASSVIDTSGGGGCRVGTTRAEVVERLWRFGAIALRAVDTIGAGARLGLMEKVL